MLNQNGRISFTTAALLWVLLVMALVAVSQRLERPEANLTKEPVEFVTGTASKVRPVGQRVTFCLEEYGEKPVLVIDKLKRGQSPPEEGRCYEIALFSAEEGVMQVSSWKEVPR